ncbi:MULTISPECIES: hypothetical protein [Ehrlichia]|nr:MULTISPECIES: hypothetical protein [Ehrlichia]
MTVASGIMSFFITRAILACQDTTEIHSTLPSIKENEQIALFIPLSDDQLNRLDPNSKIVEIKYDRVATGINLNGEKDIVLNITQKKYGLCATRVVDVVVNSDRKCMLLTSNQGIAQVSGRGIFIVVNKRPSTIKDITSKMRFYIKYPEMKDGVLSLTCNYSAMCSSIKGALGMLRYKVESAGDCEEQMSLYELLLKEMFRSCPSDSSLVVPSDTSIRSGTESLWINQSDGQLTMALLINFSTSMVLGRGSRLNNDKKLFAKITLLQDYIVQNGITSDPEIFPKLFEKIRYKFCKVHRAISQYRCLYNDYYTKYGVTFSELIRSEIRNGNTILAAMVAIASYQCRGTDFATATNSFLKEILSSVGSSNLIAEVNDIINGDLYARVNLNSYKLLGLGISSALKVISKSLGAFCTNEQLIDCARNYIMSKCYSSVTTLEVVPCSLKFRSVQDIMLCNVTTSEPVVDNSNVECFSHGIGM